MSLSERALTDQRNLSEQAYDRIRRDILQGELLPDQRLQIEAVSARYGIGAVPVREALNRLSSEGWVGRRSHRGFFVSSMSMEDLEELVKTRIWLETKALSESMAHATEEWEERLVLAYHRLARTQRRLTTDQGQEYSQDWEDRHKEFHLLLLERCGSSWLLGFCSTMMDQAVRYRNLSMNSNQPRRDGAALEHQAILDAVLDNDVEAATTRLTEHYRATLEGLRTVIR